MNHRSDPTSPRGGTAEPSPARPRPPRRVAAMLALLALTVATPARADDQFRMRPPGAPSTLEAGAEATVRVPPDQATLSLGVVTEAPTARAAADDNARKATEVLQAVARLGITGKDVRTQALDLSPVFDNRPNEAPRIRGYRATNQIVVTTTDLALVGRLLDEATRVGANAAGGLRLGLTDPVSAQNQAYRQATRDALARVTAMADAIGKRVTRVVEIRAADVGSPRPLGVETMRAASASMSTPVEPGEIAVTARVIVRAEFQ